MTRYDIIGRGYAAQRRPDPRIAAAIDAALGDARTLVTVGAGTGSYEPADREVTAVEPSAVMRGQRAPDAAPCVDATAGHLPFPDDAFDAALAVLTVHHWDAEQEAGVRELRRVARGPVVVLTAEPDRTTSWWLGEYLPEVVALDRRIFPAVGMLAAWLGGSVDVRVVPVPRDCTDGMLLSFWAHPERALEAEARAATSGFARQEPRVIDRVVADLSRDLADGSFDTRWGHLRDLEAFDAGLRLVVATP